MVEAAEAAEAAPRSERLFEFPHMKWVTLEKGVHKSKKALLCPNLREEEIMRINLMEMVIAKCFHDDM